MRNWAQIHCFCALMMLLVVHATVQEKQPFEKGYCLVTMVKEAGQASEGTQARAVEWLQRRRPVQLKLQL